MDNTTDIDMGIADLIELDLLPTRAPQPKNTATAEEAVAAARAAVASSALPLNAAGQRIADAASPRSTTASVITSGATVAAIGAQLVAGAAAASSSSGRLFSWLGRGGLARAALLTALADAGLPASWAPRSKTLVAQLGRAVSMVALRRQLVPRAVKRGGKVTWSSRWQLGTVSGADVGQAYGSVELTATLAGETLTLDGPVEIADAIRERFDALVADESLDAADITHWLRHVIVEHCGGAALGVAMWVPARPEGFDGWQAAEALLTALQTQRWGTSWMLPGIPVTTTDELARGIAAGLVDEVRDLAAAVARTAGGASCKLQLERTAALSERAMALGGVLGQLELARVLASCRALADVIREGHTDVELRAQALELI